MADYIVGLDFGSRSIKMVLVDTTKEPRVVDWDEELLAYDRDPYLAKSKDDSDQGQEGSEKKAGGGSDETTDHSAEGSQEESDIDDTDEWEADLGPSAAWSDGLDRLLSRHSFPESTEIITFLPEGRAISIHQGVPFAEEEKVKSILPNQLEDRLPLDPDEITYDFKIISDAAREEHTAVVGLGRDSDIGTFIDRLGDSGVNPAVLGIPELMLRYVAEAAVPAGETAAVVDIGHQFTRVIVLHDGEIVLARSIQVAGRDVTEKIAEKFNLSIEQAETYKNKNATVVPPVEARNREEETLSEAVRLALKPLVRDLRRNFQSLYAQERIRLDKIYLCGGTSKTERLEEYLTDEFGVTVDPLPIWSAIDFQVLEGDGTPETAMAVACALQPVRDRQKERLLDLRKGEFAYRGRTGYIRSQILKYGAAAAVLVMLFFGSLLAKKYQLEAQRAAMEQAVAEQTKELFGKSFTDQKAIKRLISGQTSSKRAFVPKMSAYQLYYELMSRVSKGTKLELDRIDVDTDRNIVQMAGTTTDPQAVDAIVSDLDKLKCLKGINKKPVKVKSENEARFELEISSNCS